MSCSFCPICSFFHSLPSQIKSLRSLESSLLRGYRQALGSGERERGTRGRKNERNRKNRSENCPLTVQQSRCRTIKGHHHDTKPRPGAEHSCWGEKNQLPLIKGSTNGRSRGHLNQLGHTYPGLIQSSKRSLKRGRGNLANDKALSHN